MKSCASYPGFAQREAAPGGLYGLSCRLSCLLELAVLKLYRNNCTLLSDVRHQKLFMHFRAGDLSPTGLPLSAAWNTCDAAAA